MFHHITFFKLTREFSFLKSSGGHLYGSASVGLNRWDCFNNTMINYLVGLGGISMVIFMILFWGAIVLLIVWLLKQNTIKNEGRSPINIIKERYAAGEITKKEYEQMKRDISAR